MILRIMLVLFLSVASGICYLAGYGRMMSALLILLGALVSFFFGLLFAFPQGGADLWFPVSGEGGAMPFFLLALLLCGLALFCLLARGGTLVVEAFSLRHLQQLLAGAVSFVLSLFLASFFWFPSAARRVEETSPAALLYGGTCLYLVGLLAALVLLYRASQGGMGRTPDLMRRLVPALFSILHLDKAPALVAYLLVYSPESGAVYPGVAALALAGYVPIACFLLLLSRDREVVLPEEER